MRRCCDVLLLSLLFVFGCEGTDPPDSDVGLNSGASKHQSHAKESGMVSKEVAAAANEAGNAVTHADLEQQIARSADQSPGITGRGSSVSWRACGPRWTALVIS